MVDEFREFVATMRVDLRRLSNEVTALSHTAQDVVLDQTSLRAYLDGQNGSGQAAGSIARAAIAEAYVAEYGLEADEQSCLAFLLFVHADRRSKFTPFGVFSDERHHVVDGNDRIVEGLTDALSHPVELGMHLVAVRRTSSGAIELTFDSAAGTVTRAHEAVVVAIPFSVLRDVDLHANLSIPQKQQLAIDRLGYGTNAKMMVGFSSRPWVALGASGTAYSDLPDCQTTWETNPALATSARAVLTDYSVEIGARISTPATCRLEASRFVSDLNVVFPGALAAATRRSDDSFVAHLEHWPSNPLSRGSYTCYLPGQFTTIAGLEGLPVNNLYFAGEHANSFYDSQGFMEGAALSGIEVAQAILRTARR